MAYTIKKTDGTTLAVIADGSANTSTDLTLIGKNYLNYGTALNENLIRLLENFANTTAPAKPIKGQLWYDSANSDLKVYSGTAWTYTTTKANAITVTGTVDAGNLNTTGTLNVTGNANVGNLGTAGLIVATGNIDGGNLNTAGALSVTGNANVGNVGTGIVIATGNVSGANINTAGTVTASRLISNVATGTSPLVVSSTTQVANLNVAVAGSLVNGTSDVTIPSSNGNINLSVGGNANVLVVSGTGANIAGTANISGNANVGNLGVSGAASVTGNVNVGNLIVNGVSNLGAIANVRVTGGTSGQIIQTDGAGNLSFTSISAGSSIINGNSNVVVSANSNVTIAVAGTVKSTYTTTGEVLAGNLTPSANATYSLGNTTNRWSNIWGVATSALYADLAEKYHADDVYSPGTVMCLGGEHEVTKSTKELDENVFGVISTNPAYLMNDNNEHPLWLPIVLTGRANVMVTGTVTKGQWLVSAGDGTARGAREGEVQFNLVIGRSLVNKTINTPALVEAYISTK